MRKVGLVSWLWAVWNGIDGWYIRASQFKIKLWLKPQTKGKRQNSFKSLQFQLIVYIYLDLIFFLKVNNIYAESNVS